MDARNSESARLVSEVMAKLNERRTLKGWAADVGGNLLVSLLTVFVVGALYVGYQNIAQISAATEVRSGL